MNDAPALDAAEIGVAMGRSGTDVLRNAAGLLLVDDNFTSIAKGIEQGRIAYDNIRKVAPAPARHGRRGDRSVRPRPGGGASHPAAAGSAPVAEPGDERHPGRRPRVRRRRAGGHAPAPHLPSQPLIDGPMLTQIALADDYMGLVGFDFHHWALGSGYDEVQARASGMSSTVVRTGIRGASAMSANTPMGSRMNATIYSVRTPKRVDW